MSSLGEQLNHVPAGAKDQFTDGCAIRLWLCEQAFGLFGVRTELLANKIGNPLGAGEVQIFFRTEVVGDGSDILPGLGRLSRGWWRSFHIHQTAPVRQQSAVFSPVHP